MKKYSVLLMYPDYMSDGTETYYAFVQAASPEEANTQAQLQAYSANGGDEECSPEDFLVLLTLSGWQEAV